MSTVFPGKLTFGLYEIDLQSGELWKSGFRIKLQSQPFKVLSLLLERHGEVVTREELQLRLWGRDTVVDFDHALGTAIDQVREALGDSAENPRFIETLARRGYRFIAPVRPVVDHPEAAVSDHSGPHEHTVAGKEPEVKPHTLARSHAQPASSAISGQIPSVVWGLVAAGIAAVGAIGFLEGRSHREIAPPHVVQITHDGHLAPTVDTMEDLRASATDGIHLFASSINNGKSGLVSIALHFGAVEPLAVSDEVGGPALGDISPDGSRLLLRSHLSPESEQPLWIVPTLGGSAQRVGGVLAHDATWMPDGSGVLYAVGDGLYLMPLGNGRPQLYANLPGRAFWMRWQPNGKLLRFTILDPIAHTTSLWEMSAADRKPVRILLHSGAAASGCCGVWTADGANFVFQSTQGSNTDLWLLGGTATDSPRRLTDGPLQFQSPVASRDGHTIYFLGMDARSELQQIGPGGTSTTVNGFLAVAVRVDFSRDGKWVAWTDNHGALWRARTDGSDKLQLTTNPLDVFLAHWSPDSKRLAFMAREPGRAWQIYTVDAQGGDPRPLLQESRNAADPSWAPDGKSIVFGRVNDMMGKEDATRNLEILRLDDSSVTQLPDSAGLFSPRWSPDGRYIVALTLDQRAVKLFDVAAQSWATLPVSSGADPVWSADSRWLFLHASMDPNQPILRISIPKMQVEEVTQLAASHGNDAVDYVFVGLSASGEPLVRERTYTGNIYSMDLR